MEMEVLVEVVKWAAFCVFAIVVIALGEECLRRWG